MATIAEWDKAVDKLRLYRLEQLSAGLAVLLGWGFFAKEFNDMGLEAIKDMVDRKIVRVKKSVQVQRERRRRN